MNPTSADLVSMQQRLARARGDLKQIRGSIETGTLADNEGDLQDEIIAYCRSKGWWVSYSRMDMKTTRPKGDPDLVIAADGGRAFWIETKSRGGKLTPEQLGVKLLMERNHQRYFVVRSMTEFLEIIQ